MSSLSGTCRRISFFAVWIVSVLSSGAEIARGDFNYADFSSLAGLTLNGDAAQVGDVLRVAPALTGTSGSAWYTLSKAHVVAGFETTFTYQMWNSPDFPDGADGFAFVIQNDSDTSLGSGGSGLGFEGIPASLAVKFDTFGFDSEPDNYISVQSKGLAANTSDFGFSLGYVIPATDLNDGNLHTVRIRYVPGTIDVFLDDLVTPALSVAIDLENIGGDDILDGSGDAWVGFTAGTGLLMQDHDIRDWNFSEGTQICDCLNATVIPDNTYFSDSTTGAPVCTSANCGKLVMQSPAKIYTFTATEGGLGLINTCNNVNYNSVISIYTGCPLTAANQIACDSSSCSPGAQVTFCATQGQTYYIRVGGVNGESGDYDLLVLIIGVGILEGPFQNPANGHWYYSTDYGPWTAFEPLAVLKGGHMATINDAAENEWVRSTMLVSGSGPVAIGINDAATEGTFVWTSGQPVTYTNWASGQPDNGFGTNEDYGVIASDGTWYDQTDCDGGNNGAIIEVNAVPLPGILAGPINNPGNCHDYYLTQPATWIEAQMKAQAMGGNLVSINNAVENEFVRTNFANFGNQQQPVWIGFTDRAVEGTFVWVDGSPVTYTHWNPGEPNDLGNEDYGMMNDAVTGGWNDAHSGGPFSGVIELPAANCPCQCRADLNGDLKVNGADVQKFVQCLLAAGGGATPPGCGCADLDHNGVLNNSDASAMVAALLAGPGCAP